MDGGGTAGFGRDLIDRLGKGTLEMAMRVLTTGTQSPSFPALHNDTQPVESEPATPVPLISAPNRWNDAARPEAG